VLPRSFNEAAHQSNSIFNVSGFFLFSVGLGYRIRHKAYMTVLIAYGGFFMLFKRSISFFSNTLRAFSASRSAGMASSRSFSQSNLMVLASSTAT